jgi:hypothetical protein
LIELALIASSAPEVAVLIQFLAQNCCSHNSLKLKLLKLTLKTIYNQRGLIMMLFQSLTRILVFIALEVIVYATTFKESHHVRGDVSNADGTRKKYVAGVSRRLMMSSNFGDEECEEEISNSVDEVPSGVSVEVMCAMWLTFDSMGRGENNDPNIPGNEWTLLCDDFESLDQCKCSYCKVVKSV